MTRQILLLFSILFVITACKKTEAEGPIMEEPEIPIHNGPGIPIEEMVTSPISISLNPQGITPLAGYTVIRTFDPTTVEMTIEGDLPINRFYNQSSSVHNIQVLGLYPGKANQVIFKITDTKGDFALDTITVNTSSLPSHFPIISVPKADTSLMEPGMNLCELNIGGGGSFKTQPFLFDHHGEVRWYINLEWTGDWTAPFNRLQNGNFIFARGPNIYEYDMIGNQVNNWQLNGYWQHHDLIEKPNGNLIVCVGKSGLDTGLDHIIELDRQSGTIDRIWDLRQVLDIDRYDLIWNANDWIHVNSVWYDETDESLVISGRHQGIFKLSKNNELIWIIAPHKGWGKAGVNGNGHETADFLLTAVDNQGIPYEENVQNGSIPGEGFEWPWGQHATMLLPNGNIFAFDNGWNRHFLYVGEDGYNRGVEYLVNEQNKTVQQVWSYGKERGKSIYSSNISDVDYLPQTGNRLICPGNINQQGTRKGMIIEVNEAGELIFEANLFYKNTLSTGQGWGQADLIYRSERLSLYPD